MIAIDCWLYSSSGSHLDFGLGIPLSDHIVDGPHCPVVRMELYNLGLIQWAKYIPLAQVQERACASKKELCALRTLFLDRHEGSGSAEAILCLHSTDNETTTACSLLVLKDSDKLFIFRSQILIFSPYSL